MKRKIIIFTVAGLLLIGVGFGVYVMFFKSDTIKIDSNPIVANQGEVSGEVLTGNIVDASGVVATGESTTTGLLVSETTGNTHYLFNKDSSGEFSVNIPTLGIILQIDKASLIHTCNQTDQNVEGCYNMWAEATNAGINVSGNMVMYAGNTNPKNINGSFVLYSGSEARNIKTELEKNNCTMSKLTPDSDINSLVGYTKENIYSLKLKGNEIPNYCDYGDYLIVDNINDKIIVVHFSAQDDSLLPSFGKITFIK